LTNNKDTGKKVNKLYRKPKGQSRMDNPEKLATSGALAKITAQKTKKMSNRTPPKTGGSSHLRRASIPSIL
jgi:hypothetical protein